MVIYILLKIIIESIGLFLKKDIKKGFIIFEFLIIFLYLLLYFLNYIIINQKLLVGFFLGLIVIILYKIIYYLYISHITILEKMKKYISEEKQKKIKNFFLYSLVCDIIYYMIGMLPGNILYGIYFGIAENGGYARVGINSTRDIILGKVFKGDSRMFFYNLFEKYNNNKIIILFYLVKDFILKALLRLLLFLSFIKKSFLELPTLFFINKRIVIFCYLSLFYFYVLEGLLFVNFGLFFFFIFIELFILFFFDKIIIFLLDIDKRKKNNNNLFILTKFISSDNLGLLYDPLNLTYYQPAKIIFETNNMVGNKILENSVTLNILNDYILFVNKNTKGYFFYKYEIFTKIKNKKLVDVSNIPGNILPQTRYIIMGMKYIQYNVNNNIIFNNNDLINENYLLSYNRYNDNIKVISTKLMDYRIKNKKNLYLSLSEKTYYNNTLLITIYLLLLNYDTLYTLMYHNYYDTLLNYRKIDKNLFFFDYKLSDIIGFKTQMGKLKLLEINKTNPEFFNIIYILHLFEYKERRLDLSADYLVRLESNKIFLPKIEKNQKFCSIKNYKNNIKLLAHFIIFNEECIVGNEDLLKYYNLLEQSKLQINYFDLLLNLNKLFSKFGESNKQSGRFDNQEDLKKSLVDDFGIIFNKNINLNDFDNFDIKNCLYLFNKNYKINEINCIFHNESTILQECFNIIKDFENIKFNDLNDLNGDKNVLENSYKNFLKKYEKK